MHTASHLATFGSTAAAPRLPGDDFNVPFEEAIAWARERKAVLPAEFYGARLQAVRARAFTVSGLAALDQIQQVADAAAQATASGQTLREWRKTLAPEVLSLGRARTELIFRNAVQTHYGIGRTIQQRENAGTRPYLMWDAINDGRSRESHAAMDGHIAPVEDPIWQRWHPLAGHNCRCSRISLTQAQAERRGLGKPAPHAQPDAGWEGDPTEGNEDLLRIVKARQDSCLTTFAAGKARARGLWCDEGAPRALIDDGMRAMLPGGDNRFMSPLRAPWPDDAADVLICAAEPAVKGHPNYAAAKLGSVADAWGLAASVLDTVDRAALRALLEKRPTLVAVQAFEGNAVNRIPAAMSQWLAGEFGGAVDRSIVQINRVGHTGASGWTRLANQALFDGDVVAGQHHVLVDDFVGQGGTLANLRGYIIAKGGLVASYVALTGQPRSAKIALTRQTLSALRSKHGNLEPWWQTKLGFSFDSLTESEALYLLRVDADTVRGRISQAGQGDEPR